MLGDVRPPVSLRLINHNAVTHWREHSALHRAIACGIETSSWTMHRPMARWNWPASGIRPPGSVDHTGPKWRRCVCRNTVMPRPEESS